MTAPTKTRGAELPLDTPATPSTGAMVKTGEPPRAPAMRAPDSQTSGSITELLRLAVEKGTPVEALEKLVALHERLSDRQAAQEFAAAMAAFQAECPPIHKSSTAEIVTKAGARFKYTYAELDEIARTVNPILAKFGLSYSWDSTVDKDSLKCICTVRHVNGHSVPASFTLPIGNESAMSAQQKVGAALTFAKRQTLTSALGLVTSDDDPDAVQADPRPISEDQATHLKDLLAETKTNPAKFLAFMGVEKIEDVPAARWKEALNVFEQKKERAK